MALLLWQFWAYSFIGYLLEKAFAAVTRSDQQVRKCFFLMPLCPVYGLGVLAALALPPGLREGFWSFALWGGLAATAVEYVVHFLYERLLHVRFWDYSGVWGSVRRRVCLPFSILWGLLLAAALPPVQALLLPLLAAVPAWTTYGVLLFFAADTVISIRLLQQTADPDALAMAPRRTGL